MTDTEINAPTPLTDAQLALVGAVVEFAEMKILFIESQQFEKAAVMKRYMDAIQGTATAIAEANARADAAERNFSLQRDNYIKLYEAVVGDGTFAGTPDALEMATAQRTELEALRAALRQAIVEWEPSSIGRKRWDALLARQQWRDAATKSAPEEGR